MIRETLDEKYNYQIDENSVVHLFRGEDDSEWRESLVEDHYKEA